LFGVAVQWGGETQIHNGGGGPGGKKEGEGTLGAKKKEY